MTPSLRRPAAPRWRGVALTGASILALAACGSGPVEIASPKVARDVSATCAKLISNLPEEIDDGVRREVNPSDALGAAWGKGDPIILVCGVPAPVAPDPFGLCVDVGGIGWLSPEAASEDQSLPVVLTTTGSAPRIEVTVPPSLRPDGPAAAMAELAPALVANLESVAPCA